MNELFCFNDLGFNMPSLVCTCLCCVKPKTKPKTKKQTYLLNQLSLSCVLPLSADYHSFVSLLALLLRLFCVLICQTRQGCERPSAASNTKKNFQFQKLQTLFCFVLFLFFTFEGSLLGAGSTKEMLAGCCCCGEGRPSSLLLGLSSTTADSFCCAISHTDASPVIWERTTENHTQCTRVSEMTTASSILLPYIYKKFNEVNYCTFSCKSSSCSCICWTSCVFSFNN